MKTRKYTVEVSKSDLAPAQNLLFTNLKQARVEGFRRLRMGTFKKLTNINGVVINLM
jgi:hypothetical protein